MTPSEKAAYQQRTQAILEQWRLELGKLRAQADEAQAQGRRDLVNSLDTLQQEAARRLETLKAAGETGWQAARQATDRALAEFESAYQQVLR